MLRTLLKYDFKRTKRLALPILLATAGTTLLGSLALFFLIKLGSSFDAMPEDSNLALASVFSMILLVGIMIVCLILIFTASQIMKILIYVDFYKSTATDEAYLTFTLPVKSRDLLFSKLFVALTWTFAQTVATILSICIFVFVGGLAAEAPEFLKALLAMPGQIMELFFQETWLFTDIFSIITVLVAYGINSTMLYLMAIFYGSVLVRKYKVLAASGCVLAVRAVYSIVINVVQYIYIFLSSVMMNFMVMSWIAFLVLTGLTVLFFVLTVRMMNQKLNLA